MTKRRYFVHVYTTIRIKVAVEAEDHRSAMRAADALVFGEIRAVRLIPAARTVVDVDYADEVTEYLVDEDGDPGFERSRSYGPDFAPTFPVGARRAA